MLIGQGDFKQGILDKIREMFPHGEAMDVKFIPEDRSDSNYYHNVIVEFIVGNYLHKFRFWQRIVQ